MLNKNVLFINEICYIFDYSTLVDDLGLSGISGVQGLGVARLVISSAAPEHTGHYFCHAKNELGEAAPINTTVIVMRMYYFYVRYTFLTLF